MKMKSLIALVLVSTSFSTLPLQAADQDRKNLSGNGVERIEPMTTGNGVERGEPMIMGFYQSPSNPDQRIQNLILSIEHIISSPEAATRDRENRLIVDMVSGQNLLRREHFEKLSRGQMSLIRRESVAALTQVLVKAVTVQSRTISNVAVDTLRVLDNPSVLPTLRAAAELPENASNATLEKAIEHLERLSCGDKLK